MNNSTIQIYKMFKSLNIYSLLILYIVTLLINSPTILLAVLLNHIFYDFLATFSEIQQTLILVTYFIISFALSYFLIIISKSQKRIVNIYNNLYFNFVTKFGKAISNKDFNEIKKNDNELYNSIKVGKAIGYCFSVSFDLLKVLKKGRIRFIANKVDDERKYRVHVLYINNDWCFNTDDLRQYKLKKYENKWEHIFYKDFFYNDIKNFDFYQFKNETARDLETWAKENEMDRVWKEEKINY